MVIRNRNDLKLAYSIVKIYEDTMKDMPKSREPKKMDRLIDLKRKIRQYLRNDENARYIISSDGNGYTEKILLPDFIESREEAEEYFNEREYRHYVPSMYDCTGQLFTCWFKVFNTNGTWRAYHRVLIDC